ncbi:MAG: hypothetical protein GX058_07690 [Firmicutes bacterium]|nr:hypothetical protein [Bacillota bacterium]
MPWRTIVFFITCIALVCALGLPAQAIFKVTKIAGGTIVPDGSTADWPPEFFSALGPTEVGNRWAIAYDDIFLHLAVIVQDPTPEFSDITSKTSLRNDAVHVYLQAAEAKVGWAITCWGRSKQTVILPLIPDSLDTRWAIARLQPHPQGYAVELSIARSALGLANDQHRNFSLQLVIVDLADGLIQQAFTLNNRPTEWQNPTYYLPFTL